MLLFNNVFRNSIYSATFRELEMTTGVYLHKSTRAIGECILSWAESMS